MLHTKEHDDLMSQFEKSMKVNGSIARKEPKEMWPKGYVYCHGETNALFLAYSWGYAYGKHCFQSQQQLA